MDFSFCISYIFVDSGFDTDRCGYGAGGINRYGGAEAQADGGVCVGSNCVKIAFDFGL